MDKRSEHRERGYDDFEEKRTEKSSIHSSSNNAKKSSRREENEHRSKDKDRAKTRDASKEDKVVESSRERRKDDRYDREKDNKLTNKYHDQDKEEREKELERNRKDREKKNDTERDRDIEKENDRGRDKERVIEKSRGKDKEREREKEKYKGREKERGNAKDRDSLERDKGKEKIRDKDKTSDHDKERSRDSDKLHRNSRDQVHEKNKDSRSKLVVEKQKDKDLATNRKGYHSDEDEASINERDHVEAASSGSRQSKSEIEGRILKMREERLKKKAEEVPELLAWVNKSRKLEEKKNTEKEKTLLLSKNYEEQDNINKEDMEDEDTLRHTSEHLAGMKILHGLDKVMEGGAVVLTLKDQNILADGDLNEDVDMLENVEIGEQKRREEAYKAAKKKTGVYEDKFGDDLGLEKKMLPQYDDPIADEGVTLDERGRFTGEAEKKLEELRRKIEGGASSYNRYEDLSSSGKITSDYYTHDEMLQFKKPKKKKSLRKKEKLDLDLLEAEAVSAGLGSEDLGSRKDGRRQAMKEEEQKNEAIKRSNAYQSAYSKADEASKALRFEQQTIVTDKKNEEEEENHYFVEEDDDFYKSLERARNLALRKKNEEKLVESGPQAIAALAAAATTATTSQAAEAQSGDPQENKVVFTEMDEFVWGLQLDEEDHKADSEDVFMEEDDAPKASSKQEQVKDEAGGWTEINDSDKEEGLVKETKEDIVMDEIIHEVPVGKGLSGVLKLLKDRGTLKETVDWGGRNMDKKKSKLVGIYENDGEKEIRIERTDEFGRIMTPKEAFRMISHKFHGKGPGKMKLEKRQKQFKEELKLKQMKNSDTPSLSVERMREAQAQSKSPYVVISGHVKPGQTSDPRSGFATVEKDLPGGLTPMLGDRKVDYFLGIKRKSEPGDMGPPKKRT